MKRPGDAAFEMWKELNHKTFYGDYSGYSIYQELNERKDIWDCIAEAAIEQDKINKEEDQKALEARLDDQSFP